MLLTILCILCVKTSQAHSNNDPTPQRELACLQDLYTSTNGPNWLIQKGWEAIVNATESVICSLHGVSCSDGEVSAIILAGNNLDGTLPNCLQVFEGLTSLVLSGNKLSGAFPELPQGLLDLEIDVNEFSSFLPDICSLTKLTTFRTNQNAFTGQVLPACIFDGQLPNLSNINLFLSGFFISEDTIQITTARYSILTLSSVSVPAEIIFHESDVATFELDLTSSNATGNVNVSTLILSYPNIRYFLIGGNNFHGLFDLESLSQATTKCSHHIAEIDLSGNNFAGICDSLEYLYTALSCNGTSDIFALDISFNKVSGLVASQSEYLEFMERHPKLWFARLEGNPFLCRDFAADKNQFSCTYINIESASLQQDPENNSGNSQYKMNVTITTSTLFKTLPAGILADQLVLSLSDIHITLIYLLHSHSDNAAGKHFYTTVSSVDAEQALHIKPHVINASSGAIDLRGVSIRYKDVVVSPQSSGASAGSQYMKAHMQPTLATAAHASGIGSNDTISFHLFGQSSYPEFSRTVLLTMNKVIEEYPAITNITNIKFQSMTVPYRAYVARGYSSLGAREAIGDFYLMCIQKSTNNTMHFFDFLQCIYTAKERSPYSIEQCYLDMLDGNKTNVPFSTIQSCASNSEGYSLVTESYSLARHYGVFFSPTYVIDDSIACIPGVLEISEETAAQDIVSHICSTYARKHDGAMPDLCYEVPLPSLCPSFMIMLRGKCVDEKPIVLGFCLPCVAVLVCILASASVIQLRKRFFRP